MNIDMIEVIENNIKLFVYPKENKVLIDDHYYPVNYEKIERLISIISTWDSEYNASGYQDGNYFEINIYYDGKIDKICGVRGAPSNYKEFTDWVMDYYDRN